LDAFRLALTDALRPLTDPVAVQATASRVLGEYLGVNRVAYFEVRGADYVVEQDYVNGAAALAGCYPIDSFGPKLLAAYQTGRAVSSPNVAADPYLSPEQRSAYAAIQIESYIGIPLVKQGAFVAGLAVHAAAPRDWKPEEIALTEEVAERTWAAVERARTEAALRQSEQRFRLMADAVPQIVWITDAEGQVEFFNKQWSHYTGVAYEATTAAAVTAAFIHPEDSERTIEAFNDARRNGSAFSVEHRLRSAAGTYRWFLVRVEPYRDPQTDELSHWFGASVDIHDRKQAEAITTTDLEHTRLLRDLSARLITEDNIQVLYDAIVSTAITLTRADAGSIQALDEAAQELVLLATQGIDRTVTDHFQRVTAGSITSCGVVLATGQRAFVDFDVPESEDPDGSLRLHVDAGLLCAQSTPLISRSGRRIGMVSTTGASSTDRRSKNSVFWIC
jgi:PAS domain S-box-containing protein